MEIIGKNVNAYHSISEVMYTLFSPPKSVFNLELYIHELLHLHIFEVFIKQFSFSTHTFIFHKDILSINPFSKDDMYLG